MMQVVSSILCQSGCGAGRNYILILELDTQSYNQNTTGLANLQSIFWGALSSGYIQVGTAHASAGTQDASVMNAF